MAKVNGRGKADHAGYTAKRVFEANFDNYDANTANTPLGIE